MSVSTDSRQAQPTSLSTLSHTPRIQLLRNQLRQKTDEALRLQDELADLRFAVEVLQKRSEGLPVDVLPEHL